MDDERIIMSTHQLSKAHSTSAINSMTSQSIPINNMAASSASTTPTVGAGRGRGRGGMLVGDRFISSPVVQHRQENAGETPIATPQSVRSQPVDIPSTYSSMGGRGASRATSRGSMLSVASGASSAAPPSPAPSSRHHGSPVRSFFGSLARQLSTLSGISGVSATSEAADPRRRRTTSSRSSLRGSRYVIVTESPCIFPSLASTMSLEKTLPAEVEWRRRKPFGDIAPAEPVSVSVQELEKQDIYDNPNYIDSITSTDSAKSLLRRTTSVPHDYHYNSLHHPKPPHVREIFSDFLPPPPPGEKLEGDFGETDEVKELMRTTDRKQWKKTLEDLLEQPEYTDTAQSNCSRTLILAKCARAIASGELDVKDLPEGVYDELEESQFISEPNLAYEKRMYMKNLLVLSFSFMLVFTAYLSMRNLQSSLNHKSGLGLYSLSCIYASLFTGCLFATIVVQKLRPKSTMALMMHGFLLYVITNFYPQVYTLIPVSFLAGFCLACVWTSHATYLTNISIRYAELTEQPLPTVLSRFNGIFYSIFQCSQILGGIISSAVLMATTASPQLTQNATINVNANITSMENHSLFESGSGMVPEYSMDTNITALGVGMRDTSMCGVNYCHSNSVGKLSIDIDRSMVYTLVGIFTALALTGILLLIFGLERLEGIMTRRASFALKDQFLSVFRFFNDWRVGCLFFLMFYSLMQMSFMFGEFTTSFVTCASGVHNVGYSMLCMSVCGALSSYANGHLQKYVGQMPLLVGASLIHMVLYVTMLLWQPTGEPSTVPVFFVITGMWGLADGVFLTQTISIFGSLFAQNKEPAFAALKMVQALGAFMLFVSSPYICTKYKIFFLMTILSLAMVGYLTLHFRLKGKKEKQELAGSPVKV